MNSPIFSYFNRNVTNCFFQLQYLSSGRHKEEVLIQTGILHPLIQPTRFVDLSKRPVRFSQAKEISTVRWCQDKFFLFWSRTNTSRYVDSKWDRVVFNKCAGLDDRALQLLTVK
jgi:hypothetical protein